MTTDLPDNYPAAIASTNRDLGATLDATEVQSAGLLFLEKQLSIIPAAISIVQPASRQGGPSRRMAVSSVPRYPGRLIPLDLGAFSQSAASVVPPGPQGAVGLQGQGVVVSGAQVDP